MGVNITTIVYLRVLIIQIWSTIILMVVEAQGIYIYTPRTPNNRPIFEGQPVVPVDDSSVEKMLNWILDRFA